MTRHETTNTDNVHYHETPEGIMLQLKLAGPVVRACAWSIDSIIRVVLYTVLGIVNGFISAGIGTGMTLIAVFLIEWFYPVVFEVHNGATPGKKAMGLVVVHDNGTPISVAASLLRNLLRVADFFPLFYGAGLLSMLGSRRFQRLGDLVAGTLVIYRERDLKEIVIPPVAPKPPPQQLSVEELRNIIAFAERSNQLTEERRIELADQMAELTGLQGQAGVKELYAYANWLTRGR